MIDETLESLLELLPPVWVTDSGQEIEVGDMSTAHVTNCLADLQAGKIKRDYCCGYANWQWVMIFKRELEGRKLSTVRF